MPPYAAYPYPHYHNTMRPLQRQQSEFIPGPSYPNYVRYPPVYHTMNPNKPSFITQHSMIEAGTLNGRPPLPPQPRSNPGTPDDPNVNILTKHPSSERVRNPSGRSQKVTVYIDRS